MTYTRLEDSGDEEVSDEEDGQRDRPDERIDEAEDTCPRVDESGDELPQRTLPVAGGDGVRDVDEATQE